MFKYTETWLKYFKQLNIIISFKMYYKLKMIFKKTLMQKNLFSILFYFQAQNWVKRKNKIFYKFNVLNILLEKNKWKKKLLTWTNNNEKKIKLSK